MAQTGERSSEGITNLFSPINGVNAYSAGMLGTSFGSGLFTSQDILLGAGIRGLTFIGGEVLSILSTASRVVPYAGITGGVIVGLHQGAKFESEHMLFNEDFNDWMANPLIPDSVKYKIFSNVHNDPLLGAKEPLKSVIDPEAIKPPPFITVPPKLPASIIYTTPDNREQLLDLTKLPGFTPDVTWSWEKLTESFPAHEPRWEDLVSYKDYEIDHWNVKPANVKEAPEVWQHNKYGKIYMDPEQTVGNKDIWWSKDTAHHGGGSEGLTPSTYKLFVKREGQFQWIGDADATGKVIENKHKSNEGRSIPIKQCWKVK